MSIVEKAEIFALAAHTAVGQKRKYSGEGYIVHPAGVVEILKEYTSDEITLAAGWLHDTVEDTEVSCLDLVYAFGGAIAKVVSEVTDPEVKGNRAYRKQAALEWLSQASPRGQNVKLADLIHNMQDIAKHDPAFAKQYIEEKKALLRVLTSGDTRLFSRAVDTLTEAEKVVNEVS